MKMNKFKIKKGMTLIEVIISVTLLSILLVPLSTVVISSLKNSKDGEYKQKASYIGQKVIEELKAYDKITLKSDNPDGSDRYYELLDGDKIKEISENNFVGNFERTIFGAIDETNRPRETKFKVEVTMKRNSSFNFNNTNNIDEDKAKYKIVFDNKGIGYTVRIESDIPQELIVSDELVFNVNNEGLEIYNKSDDKIKIYTSALDDKENILLIDVKDTYDKATNINLSNNSKDLLEINLIKEKSLNNIKINSYKGNILLSEFNKDDLNNIANMYNYEVVVKDTSDKVLFKGSSSSNNIIK